MCWVQGNVYVTARTSIDGRVDVLGARERVSHSKDKY
jgi:hypothetical protein